MNIKRIFRVLGALSTVYSFVLLFPAIVSLLYKEHEYTVYFLFPSILLVVFGAIILFITKNIKSQGTTIRQSLFLVSFSWVSVSLLGVVPFLFSKVIPDFSSALFETVSGFTTTGASILTNIEILPKSMLFWRSFTQWLGGMGIVVLTVALFPLLGIGGSSLVAAESPGPELNKITPKVSNVAKIFWLIYIGLTALETVLLYSAGMNLFDAVTHSFATMATGGFSTQNTSIAEYSLLIQGIITLFMFFAGINFALYFTILTGKAVSIFNDTEFRWYVGVTIFASLCIMIILIIFRVARFGEAIVSSLFQATSIITTTGFASVDFEQWPYFAQAILLILMFFGGCAGSTGGGVKVIRIVTSIKFILSEFTHFFMPQKVSVIKINNKKIDNDYIRVVLVFILTYIFLLLITTIIISSQNIDLLTSFTAALSTLGNIGPGFGNIGPAENYAFFSPTIKLFLSFIMIAGRLELFTVLILFTPRFWR